LPEESLCFPNSLGHRSGAGCTFLVGYPLLTDETLKGKLSFLEKDTERRAGRGSKG